MENNNIKFDGWELEDLSHDLAGANPMEMMTLYVREDDKYKKACSDLVNNENEKMKESLIEECQKRDFFKTKIALALADILTNNDDHFGTRS